MIGTVFVDCKGLAKQNYQSSARNLGEIRFVHGGVGRNVAENLAKLSLSTCFISSVDISAMGEEVVSKLQESHVNISYLIKAENRGMGIWMAIIDDKGDLAGSISQMPDLALLEEFILQNGEKFIQEATHIVLEVDLNISITQRIISLARKEKKPVYGIPGNFSVVISHSDILGQLECFICNNFEADLLIHPNFTHMNTNQKLNELMHFVDRIGIRSMIVTMGKHGSIYYDCKSKARGYQPVFPVTLIDSSGAGDAFFSGTVMGLVRGLTIKEAVICGTKVAGWTIESIENTYPDLSMKIRQDEFFKSLKLN
ncbi:PfkB family carbohydrate kinase [Ammoniphilus sp. 3BR4]|uniref:PfkB family carbohydrate kinase n=1 Tax=Ammoniphilus sp. 3BR4 TaxID=3158265 RepID=UPI003465581B